MGTVNAVNITDGLDGLSTSVTIPVAAFFSVMAIIWPGFAQLGTFSAAMLGGLCGFLVYNRYPAKVFMGDTGSLFLGGAVAALAFAYDMPLVLLLVGIVYICVGETLEQRELGITMELIALQVKSALAGVPAEKLRKCVIAYEPVWAIGTGKTATAEQAAEVCTFIRTTVRHLYGARIARSITIQYGGSMKPANAAELLGQPDIDGGLIGGAALNAADFVEIINAANQD